ncbi:MAG: hypothetical protein DLM59_20350 [Pseudonocardiales bacterium]|nr:MAG: hypothetical protein DLM59_20350 [Pseudonocardiales bacterium]
MSIPETVLVYLGIPFGVVLLVVAAVYGTSSRHGPRYRPGRPFAFEPAWYVAARPPHPLDDPARPALPPVDVPLALPVGSPDPAATPTTTGGARGSW